MNKTFNRLIGYTLLSIPAILALILLTITFGFWEALVVFLTATILSFCIIGCMIAGSYFLTKSDNTTKEEVVEPEKPPVIEDPALAKLATITPVVESVIPAKTVTATTATTVTVNKETVPAVTETVASVVEKTENSGIGN